MWGKLKTRADLNGAKSGKLGIYHDRSRRSNLRFGPTVSDLPALSLARQPETLARLSPERTARLRRRGCRGLTQAQPRRPELDHPHCHRSDNARKSRFVKGSMHFLNSLWNYYGQVEPCHSTRRGFSIDPTCEDEQSAALNASASQRSRARPHCYCVRRLPLHAFGASGALRAPSALAAAPLRCAAPWT